VIIIGLLCVSYLALKLNEAKDNAQRQLAHNYWDNGRQAREAGNYGMAKHFMAAAIEATPDLAAARSIVQDLRADLYIRADLMLQHQGSVWGAQFSRDESRILTWSSDNTARVWQISGDVDFPKDKTVLQIEALNGTKFNPITRVLEIMPAHEFNDTKEKYLQIAREHARTCQYPRQNIYLHFWGDKDRVHTR